MKVNMHNATQEGGNAVTLTLLGLSVAILAGVAVLYFIGKTAPEQVYVPPSVDEERIENSAEVEKKPREGWSTYVSNTYDFSVEYPIGWVVATGTLSTGDPVVSLYKATGTSTDMVFGQQDVASHVSVYPLGIATEGIQGVMSPSTVIVEVPQASAKDYVLFETKRPWATKATFEQHPASWNDSGFVFARVAIEEEELLYMRGEEEIAQYEFDPFTGDRVERIGFIDTAEREVQEEILRSFRFTGEEVETLNENDSVHISIEAPKPDVIVTSPLSVQGTISGKWHFEDEYVVRVETIEGDVVTEVPITLEESQGDEEVSPFEVSLVFEVPTYATSGVVVIDGGEQREEEAYYSIPVRFLEEEGTESQV